MKKINQIQNKQLTELLNEASVLDPLDVCRVICDYYSKYESPVWPCNPEIFKMAALSNAGREVYSTLSLGWEQRVPYTKMAAISMELDFKVLVFATSWDGFSKMVKRIDNLGTICTVKVFAVKDSGEKLDKDVILQLIDWIENDTVPTEWKEEVKCKTIKR